MESLTMLFSMIIVIVFLIVSFVVLFRINTIVELNKKQLNNLRAMNEHLTGKQPDNEKSNTKMK
jgi:hypothetical protein